MKRPLAIAAALSLLLVLGCSKQNDSAAATPPVKPAAAGTSALDQGPRAAESAVDEELAEQGEQLFKDKGCSACHAFGQRVTGPDLAGVSHRRTGAWIQNQILHPDQMTKEDPIARKLFAEFALQMPNQGLTEVQARAVLEYFKHRDHEAAEAD